MLDLISYIEFFLCHLFFKATNASIIRKPINAYILKFLDLTLSLVFFKCNIEVENIEEMFPRNETVVTERINKFRRML